MQDILKVYPKSEKNLDPQNGQVSLLDLKNDTIAMPARPMKKRRLDSPSWLSYDSVSLDTIQGAKFKCLIEIKACNESYEEQLPDFDSWALTAVILLS